MPFKLEGAQDVTADTAQVSKPFKLEGAQDTSNKDGPSFSQRVGADISENVKNIAESNLAQDMGKIGNIHAGVNTAEGIGGIIGAPLNEAVQSGINAVPEVIKKPVGQAVKQAAEYAGSTNMGIVGRAGLGMAQRKLDELKSSDPELYKTVTGSPKLLNFLGISPTKSIGEAAGNVVVKGGEKVAPSLIKAGETLTKAGEAQAVQKEAKSLINLVSPKVTKKIAEENVGKTVERGLLRKQEIIPDKFTQDIADTVSKVPEVNPNRSYQYNYNKIAAENKAEAQTLSMALKASNVTIPANKINKAAQDVRDSLAKQTFIVGDAKKVSDKMMKEAGNLIKKNGSTAEGLLRTRQEFDAWAKGQMGGDPFSDSNKARGASLKAVRDSLNGLIADAVPSAQVKQSLTKQFHLYNALDNIRAKAAGEGKNIITRTIAKLEDNLPTKNPYIKHTASLAGLGLAATHPATLAAAVPYAAYRGITSPTTKKVLGGTLTRIGDALK